MKRNTIFVILLCAVILTAAVWAYGEDSEDLLVTKSYLYQIFAPTLQQDCLSEAEAATSDLRAESIGRMENIYYIESSEAAESVGERELKLSYGDVLQVYPYTTVRVIEGKIRATALSGEWINLNEGTVCGTETVLQDGQCYFTAEESFVNLRIYTDSAALLIRGAYALTQGLEIPWEERFIDVTRDQWFAPHVQRLAERGIVSGITKYSFQPSAVITRAAFVTILGRMCKIEAIAPQEARFTDVAVSEWYAPYVAWAAEAGIVNGYSDGSFRPNQSVSREQMATMLYRFMEYGKYAQEESQTEAFSDEAEIAEYALEAVRRIRAAGLINGRENDCFDPKGTATRAEACAVVCRLMDKTEHED